MPVAKPRSNTGAREQGEGPEQAARARAHVCTECGKAMRTAMKLMSHLWKHIRVLRRRDLNAQAAVASGHCFICTECGRISPTYQTYAKHVRSHKFPNLFDCTDCPRTFKSQMAFRRHMTVAHSKGGGPRGCPQCPDSPLFLSTDALERHDAVVHGRTFPCLECTPGSPRSPRSPRSPSSRVSPSPSPATSPSSPATATCIGTVFYNHWSLKVHLLRDHSDVRPFPFSCKLCAATFKWRARLKVHLKAAHPRTGSPVAGSGTNSSDTNSPDTDSLSNAKNVQDCLLYDPHRHKKSRKSLFPR